MTLFSKLRELEKKATPGEWDETVWCGDLEANKWAAVGPQHEQAYSEDELDPSSEAGKAAERDAALIAEMRNALPKIFEVLDLYEEALVLYEQRGIECCHEPYTAREALKRAKEIAGD